MRFQLCATYEAFCNKDIKLLAGRGQELCHILEKRGVDLGIGMEWNGMEWLAAAIGTAVCRLAWLI